MSLPEDVAALKAEIERYQNEARTAFLSGYMQGASVMRAKIQSALKTHYDYGLNYLIGNMPIPAPEE